LSQSVNHDEHEEHEEGSVIGEDTLSDAR